MTDFDRAIRRAMVRPETNGNGGWVFLIGFGIGMALAAVVML